MTADIRIQSNREAQINGRPACIRSMHITTEFSQHAMGRCTLTMDIDTDYETASTLMYGTQACYLSDQHDPPARRLDVGQL